MRPAIACARARPCSSHDALARLNVIAPSWGCQRAAVASRPPSAPLLRKDPMANDTRGEFPLHHDDHDTNSSGNESFARVLDKRLSRRSLLKGTAGLAAGTLMSGSLWGCNDSDDDDDSPKALKLDFAAVAKSLADAVVGARRAIRRRCCIRLGDPIAAGVPDYATTAPTSGASFAAARRRPPRRHALLRPRRGGTTTRAQRPRAAGDEPREHHAALPARERPDHVNGVRTVPTR